MYEELASAAKVYYKLLIVKMLPIYDRYAPILKHYSGELLKAIPPAMMLKYLLGLSIVIAVLYIVAMPLSIDLGRKHGLRRFVSCSLFTFLLLKYLLVSALALHSPSELVLPLVSQAKELTITNTMCIDIILGAIVFFMAMSSKYAKRSMLASALLLIQLVFLLMCFAYFDILPCAIVWNFVYCIANAIMLFTGIQPQKRSRTSGNRYDQKNPYLQHN